MKEIIVGLAILFSWAFYAEAEAIIPVSYEYVGNFYPYGPPSVLDTSATKLTDGLHGGFIPGVAISPADPSGWVEFGGAGEVRFQFSSSVTVTNIVLSMLRWEPAAIYLPDLLKVNGADYSGYAGSFNDQDQALINLDGTWTGTDLTIRFAHSQYLFMDEVSFSALAQPVPEPSTLLLSAIGIPLLVISTRATKKLSIHR